jgi:two-component system response regulator
VSRPGSVILVVEDDPNDLELTLHALRRSNLDSPLAQVRDGREALEYLFQRGRYAGIQGAPKPGLVLLDLKLPLVDGLEVLRQVKNDERTRTIPVVALSSSSQEPDLQRAYALGVNSYIVKPVDIAQFFDAIGKTGLYWALLNERLEK